MQATYLVHALQHVMVGAYVQNWVEVCGGDPWNPDACTWMPSGFGVPVNGYRLVWDLVAGNIDARSDRHDRIFFDLTAEGRAVMDSMYANNGYAILVRGWQNIGIGGTNRASSLLHPGFDRSFKTPFNWGFNLQFSWSSSTGRTDFDIDFNPPSSPWHLGACNSQVSCHFGTYEQTFGAPPPTLLTRAF